MIGSELFLTAEELGLDLQSHSSTTDRNLPEIELLLKDAAPPFPYFQPNILSPLPHDY